MAKKLYLYIALCVFLSALSIGAGTGDAELEPFKCAVEGILNCEGCEGGTVYYGVKFLSGTRQQLNFTEMTTLYPFAYKENATDSEPCNDDNFGDPLEEARKWCWCDLNPITTVTNTPTSVGVSVPTPKATVFCDECVRDTPSDELLSREEILKIILPTSLGVVFIVSLLLCPQKTVRHYVREQCRSCCGYFKQIGLYISSCWISLRRGRCIPSREKGPSSHYLDRAQPLNRMYAPNFRSRSSLSSLGGGSFDTIEADESFDQHLLAMVRRVRKDRNRLVRERQEAEELSATVNTQENVLI
mmetsp:Transcript_16937/g.20905  ORF Transcript_16937/g.20905 Transcript_16937/m.20905 type:complete len:301 (+) Transcript_16937:67-969(+)